MFTLSEQNVDLTLTLGPLIKQNRLNVVPINPEIFKFLLYVNFFIDFQYQAFREVLRFQIYLTQAKFELEMCYFLKTCQNFARN